MNYITLILWALFIFLLTILIGIGLNGTNNFLVEGFGVECLDYNPFKLYPKYPMKPDTIFVSVASYRDQECSLTISTLFNNARYPERIFVGICEQNKKGVSSELCIPRDIPKGLEDNIRIAKMDYTKAKGPTYARYIVSRLWRGEQYYFQIDSHNTFVKDWDIDLIQMIRQIKETSKPVLSVYPPAKEQMTLRGFPEFDNGKINEVGIPVFVCGWSEPSEEVKRSNKPIASGNFLFLDSSFLREVPFDPNLSHLFHGEEILFSARLWTAGWDFYTPNKKICYHHYNRRASLYHQDIKDSAECREKAEKRVLFLLGLLSKNGVPGNFLRDYNYYGLGKFRTIGDFWKVCGVDFMLRTVEKWNDKTIPSIKYDGWWFRRDGWKKIKKF